MNKKVIVCGDSFMTPVSGNYANTHFTEILTKRNNWHTTYYSRQAMSNAGICIQIEEAITKKPDLVLIGTSQFDRVEIAIDNQYDVNKNDWSTEDILDPSNPEYKNRSLLISTFGVLIGNLSDITFPSIYKKVPEIEEKLKSLKGYFTNLYSPNFKRRLDRWCLEACMMKLYLNKIPFCIVIDRAGVECPWDLTADWGKTNSKHYAACYEAQNHIPWVVELYEGREYNWDDPEYRKWALQIDPGYHTLPKHQILLADYVDQHLTNFF